MAFLGQAQTASKTAAQCRQTPASCVERTRALGAAAKSLGVESIPPALLYQRKIVRFRSLNGNSTTSKNLEVTFSSF